MEVFCFFAGIAFAYVKTLFPLFIVVIALFFRQKIKYLFWFCLGVAWAIIHVLFVSSRGLPDALVVKNADLEGVVVSIPLTREGSIQFDFDVNLYNGKKARGLIRLSCYDHCPNLKVNQRYRLQAKLKRPLNYRNPGGFNYAGSLISRHIQWTGYTKRDSFRLLSPQKSIFSIVNLRAKRAELLELLDKDPKTIGIFEALTLGLTHRMSKENWDLFRQTGTTHLMVISGAHIGLVAGLTYRLFKFIWTRIPHCSLLIPAQRIASGLGFVSAFGYAVMAGFGVPAQRALIVCFFMFLRFILHYPFSVWQAWRCALFIVIFYEPHSVMFPGFYLSFIAVAILISVNQRVHITGFRKILILQLACLVGLMPLTLYLFSYGSLNGFFANIIAIPWVSFLIIPLALIITIMGGLVPMSWPTLILKWQINALLWYLHWIDSFSMINIAHSLSGMLTPIALMLALVLFVFIPHKSFYSAIFFLMIASVFPRYETIKSGAAIIDILDVGQGLAVVVRTSKHILIYDTGVKFYHGTDMGKLVIIPYLKTLGIKQLDAVVISHPDLDHRGGLASVQAEYRVKTLLVDNPAVYQNAQACHEQSDWTWDGVTFKFFPIKGDFKGKNNRSCVLQVSTKNGQVLLTGDIEKPAEDYLVKTYSKRLASEFLVIPHHGSKTSSSAEFLEYVMPQYALLSYGFDNRYFFPHAKPMNEYIKRQIPVYSTVSCGLIRINLTSANKSKKPDCMYNNIDKNMHII